jgi:hypothetical protein
MKNKISKILLVAVVSIALYACKKSFLDAEPQGVVSEATLANENGVNKLLLGAYAMLDGFDDNLQLGAEMGTSGSNSNYGSMGGGEANKGSTPQDLEANLTPVVRHEVLATNRAINDRWKALYEGVKRCNTVLLVLAKASDIKDEERKNITGQARFLRAWYHFQARITFGKIPYLDEKIDEDLISGKIPGVANDTETWPQILADAKFAFENLPAKMDAIGRINKWTAGALYGKILMFAKDFAAAKTVLTDVVNNGTNSLEVPFGLNDNFDDAFNVDFDNSIESVFAFQASVNDGSFGANGNEGDSPFRTYGVGCCGFFTPTYWLTNTFKTDAAGLPDASPYTSSVMDPFSQAGLTQYAGNVDIRLDWTAGRIGVPFYDWGIPNTSWTFDIGAGPFHSKKNTIRKSQLGAAYEQSFWSTAAVTSQNINLIRFADVILLLAEAEVEVGSLPNAFALVNRIRNRAKNSRVVSFSSSLGTPKTEPYATMFASQDQARAAVRYERKLELAMEGHRFFDLVRWGAATTELNAFYNYESSLPYQTDLIPKPVYTSAKDYYPIPQQQIDLSKGLLKQN